jgi:hypothetical protein
MATLLQYCVWLDSVISYLVWPESSIVWKSWESQLKSLEILTVKKTKRPEGVKAVSVDLDPALHVEVKAVGGLRGQSLPESYTEALTRWLEWVRGGAAVPSPLGELTPMEERILRGLLMWLRDPGAPKGAGTIMDVLMRLADAYEGIKTRGSPM